MGTVRAVVGDVAEDVGPSSEPDHTLGTAAKAASVPVEPFGAIRALHHRLARLAASGADYGFMATACSVPLAQVTALSRSPAFLELVAHYTAERRGTAL